MGRFGWLFFYSIFPGLAVGIVIGRHLSPSNTALKAQIQLLEQNLESHRHRRSTEDHFDIRIVGAATRFDASTYKGEPLTAQQVLDALPNLLTELDRYPVSAIKSSGIKKIVLCGTLFSLQNQEEGGLADVGSGTLYLSIPAWDSTDVHLRHNLHHEIYHFIDRAYVINSDDSTDEEWRKLNAKDFVYGSSGFSALADMRSTEMTDRWSGFVTPYCRSAIEEDKAETFACMMDQPTAVAFRAKSDRIVAAKAEVIRM